MDTPETIHALEVALARRDAGALPGGYDGVLDDAFVEVGQSGRVWTRDEMLMALAASPPDPTVQLVGFSVDELAPKVWLARYDTVGDGVRHHRSSIWIRSGDRFRMRYHQGTPAADLAS
jgi:ribonuclease HI